MRLLFLLILIIFVGCKPQHENKVKLFWTDAFWSHIATDSLDNTKIIVTEAVGFPWRITIDDINEKLYWTNVKDNKIQRSNYDGTRVENLTSIKLPTGDCFRYILKGNLCCRSWHTFNIKNKL